ncbi:hypothetical protein BS47DRAFT_670021 [Hydnum rufescens UP504]|uniref:Protein kinase domain-containing protein n=1 Tax=Hydnum rufescens UP504 TaxID=1448309 RepID=A0A9P6B2I4_9AGAM|nr:hypothetical protein BS47DRAFT_670021 [Hydnum rufescens UP504]
MHAQNYDIKGIIGRGGSSQVYIADCKRGRLRGRRVAIKIIPLSALPTSTHVSHHISSTALHLKLHHPSILSLLSVFQTANEYFHVLELCSSGTLASFLVNRPSRCLSENEARSLLRALIDGFTYLTRERVVHRDLKADNILLTEDYRVKLADFGLATKLEAPRFEASTFCGTPNYLSPEVIARQPYGLASDLWALGCLTITILTGKPPFQGDTVDATLLHASGAQYVLPQTLSQEARDLIGNLLQIDPDRRIPLHKILSHPFFSPALPSTPLAPPSFYPSPSPLILSDSDAVWTNKENISPKRGILSKNANSARHHRGLDSDSLLDLRRTIDRPILGEHILNAPVMDPNIRRKPPAARIPSISQVSFISTSTKPPPSLPLHSSDRFSGGNGVHRMPHPSTSTDLKGRSGYKSIPVPARKSSANYRSHLISPPSTAVSHSSKPALKGKYSRPYDRSIVNSALTTNSLTPSASASQIPSRQVSAQHHPNDSDIPKLPINGSQQPIHTRHQQHSNKSNNPVSASLEHDTRQSMLTSHISDLTVPSTVRKLVSPSRHVNSIRLPIDRSRRPRSPQNKDPNDQASGVPVRLEASCLPPRTYATPHGHITILQDSCDLVVDLRESERRSGRSGTEVLKISSDGRMVSSRPFVVFYMCPTVLHV